MNNLKLALVSLGCSKNLVDGETYLGMLINNKGCIFTENPEEADIVIVNTCGFIEEAKKESVEAILEIARYKTSGNLKKLIVTGCLVQKYKSDFLTEIPEIDGVIGTGEIDQILTVVDEINAGNRVAKCDNIGYIQHENTERFLTTPKHIAYVKIAEGCNRNCTYCIIPKLRGNLRSREIDDIVKEVTNLSLHGVEEINLLAQETTEYGHDIYGRNSLADLLRELVKITGIKWIRIYYLYPGSFDNDLLELIRTEPKICNYFDFPIQHVSDNILRKMGRNDKSSIIKKLENIRTQIPDATIRTSIIVGFPGETEEEFQELKNFIKTFKFDYVGVFKYSREEDTVAYDLPDQIPEDIKEKRWVELCNIQRQIADMKSQQYAGDTINVMIDSISEDDDYAFEGRHEGQAYDIDGKVFVTCENTSRKVKVGDIVPVVIEESLDYDLIGSIK